jgi:hypothetical protein
MTRGPVKWTESKILDMEANGFGKGTGSRYQPWLCVEATHSLGRARRVWSCKTGRTHHLLSDVEYNLFLALEWQQDIIDIREQYPLDRSISQETARSLRIRHPHYPGTKVPTVMTVDFLVTKQVGSNSVLEAFNAKRDEEAEDENSLLKLEIQREYFAQLGVPHHLVFHSQISDAAVANIAWIRDALVKSTENEPRPGYFATLASSMALELARVQPRSLLLSAFCSEFDIQHGLEPGTGLRVARILLHSRVLSGDLLSKNLADDPLSRFLISGKKGPRALGER